MRRVFEPLSTYCGTGEGRCPAPPAPDTLGPPKSPAENTYVLNGVLGEGKYEVSVYPFTSAEPQTIDTSRSWSRVTPKEGAKVLKVKEGAHGRKRGYYYG